MQAAAAACAAAAALLLLWREARRAQRDARQEGSDASGGGNTNETAAKRDPLLAEWGGRIPADELRPLAQLLRTVQAARGWRDGCYNFAQAWARAEARAAGDAGGGWEAQFEPASMSDARVAALAAVIDQELLGGLLLGSSMLREPWRGGGGGRGRGVKQRGGRGQARGQRGPGTDREAAGEQEPGGRRRRQQQQQQQQQQQEPRPQQRQRKRQPQQEGAPPSPPRPARAPPPAIAHRVVDSRAAGWLAYFDEAGAVYINRWRWDKDVSAAAPVNCEGVVCTSRLQMLMHTLAHELVHAVVFYAFPEMDASSPAYLADGRHGPVFQLLNRGLFGHPSNSLARCNARAALGGGA